MPMNKWNGKEKTDREVSGNGFHNIIPPDERKQSFPVEVGVTARAFVIPVVGD